MTVAEALAAARALGVARLDAQLLLARLLARPRAWLLAHDDAPLAAEQAAAYRQLLQRRAAGEPLAYLVGEREFHGLSLQVTPAVLVPRPDTETLVDWAMELLAPGGPLAAVPAPQVLDLGTGSGAIALALKHRCPRAVVQALDASEAALAVARDNARRLQLDVSFVHSDWWGSVPPHSLDLAVSNPPYIAESDPHLAELTHEPLAALTPGGDGLGALERLIAGAPAHLRAPGWLLLEHGHDQGAAVRKRLVAQGFTNVSTRLDIEGRERCSGGCWPV
ncbi:MAG: peptide chain release factor N(5)-glutamine methyltransferase [Pseudomonadota bacterium]